MTHDVATLWGMDGRLDGEETSLQGRLPFFGFGGRIYAARLADWSFDDDSLQLLSEVEALERGAALPFAQEVPVTPGRLVVTTGPKFIEWCRDLDLDIPEAEAQSKDGFEVRTMLVADYEQLATTLAVGARTIFDTQLRANGDLTDRAQIALDVFRNTGAADPRSKFIRSIAAARLACDPDAVRRLAKLAQVRLHTSLDGLNADVDQYQSEVFSDPHPTAGHVKMPQAAIPLESVKADRQKIVRPEFFPYDQSFRTVRPLVGGSRCDPTYKQMLREAGNA